MNNSTQPIWKKRFLAMVALYLFLFTSVSWSSDNRLSQAEQDELALYFFPTNMWFTKGEKCAWPVTKEEPDSGFAVYRVFPHPVNKQKLGIIYSLHYRKDCGTFSIGRHNGDIESFGYSLQLDESCSNGWKLSSVKTIAHAGTMPFETEENQISSCGSLEELISSQSKHAIYQSSASCQKRLPPEEACDKGFTGKFQLRNAGSNEHRITDDISEYFPSDSRTEYVWKDPGDGKFCGGISNENCVTAAYGHLTSYKRTPELDQKWGEKTSGHDIFEDKNWVADLNGDGKDDYIYLRRGTDEYWALIAKSDGTGFHTDQQWGEKTRGHDIFENKNWVADLNGDGKDDYFYLRRKTHEYWALIAKSDGTGFHTDQQWGEKTRGHDIFEDKNWVADLNGDGKDDYFYLRRGTDEYWALIAKSDGTGFHLDQQWGEKTSGHDIFEDKNWVTDLNGDGKDDYFYLRRGTDEYWALIAKSDDTGFHLDQKWGEKTSGNDIYENKNWVVDVNGDGKDDYVYVRRNTFNYQTLITNNDGTGFENDRYLTSRVAGYDIFQNKNWVANVNGDGIDDLLYLRRGTDEYRALLITPELVAGP